jgi:hypothetical protein
MLSGSRSQKTEPGKQKIIIADDTVVLPYLYCEAGEHTTGITTIFLCAAMTNGVYLL